MKEYLSECVDVPVPLREHTTGTIRDFTITPSKWRERLCTFSVYCVPVDAPGRDGEEGGKEEPRPQDVDSLAELLDRVAPDQAHRAKQH